MSVIAPPVWSLIWVVWYSNGPGDVASNCHPKCEPRGVVTASDSPFVPVGSGTLGQRVDNGEGAGAPPDESAGILTSPVPGPCPPPFLATLPVEQGNVVVHDGS